MNKKTTRPDTAKTIKFTVASALLSELGERLVGAPHIALAELVKNSYDADATKVIIRFANDRIEIIDNGHGMDFTEFRNFWMRIGTPHKQEERVSPKFQRPMTGSKGIGRLSVQFLASNIEIHTVSEENTADELRAIVDWAQAVKAGDLIQAEAGYDEIERQTEFPKGKQHGTIIILSALKQNYETSQTNSQAAPHR